MANKLFNTIIQAGHFTMIVLTFSLLLISYIKIKNTEYKYIQTIGLNWNSGPILSISANTGACPIEEKLLFTDEWPGTTDGCDCSNISFNFYSQPLMRGTCSSLASQYNTKSNSYNARSNNHDNTRYNNYDSPKNLNQYDNNPYSQCIDIKPISSSPYTNWGGRTLCAKRYPTSYLDLIVVDQTSKCPIETRSCGIIDSIGNYLCVSTSNPCPINKLLILNEGDKIPIDFKYSLIQLQAGKTLIYTNENVRGDIIHEFKLSEGQPCLNPNYSNINSDQYLLSNVLNYDGCPESGYNNKMFDSRYNKIDSEDLLDFYTMNGIEDKLKRLPQYKPSSSFSYIDLYEREYFGLTEYCFAKVHGSTGGPSELIKTLLYFEDNIGNIVGWVLAAFIFSCFALVFELCLPCCVCCDDKNGLNKTPIWMLVFHFVFSVSLIICVSISYSKISSLPDNYLLISGGCSDAETDSVISDFVSNFGVGTITCFYSLIIVLSTFVYNFFYITFGVIKKEE